MPGRLGFTSLDYTREKKSFSIATGDVTAVSLAGLLTEVGALRSAVDGITRTTISDESLSVFNTNLSNIRPVSKDAQNETAWLVQYEDITPFFDDPINAIPNEAFGRLYTVTIPGAELSLLTAEASELADMTAAPMIAFKTAFENTARTPAGGRVRITKIEHVGRNS